MKKLLFAVIAISLLSLCPQTLRAQIERGATSHSNYEAVRVASSLKPMKRHYESNVEIDAELMMGEGLDIYPNMSLTYQGGCRFNRYLFLGAGIGYKYNFDDELHCMPIFASFRWYWLPRKFTPFLEYRVGGVIHKDEVIDSYENSTETLESHFATSLRLGFNHYLNRRLSLYYAVGVTYNDDGAIFRGTYYHGKDDGSAYLNLSVGLTF